MYPSLTGPLPRPSYLRLLEYQRQRMVFPAYAADLPLLLFIFFSRIAAGLSILSVVFPHSVLWTGLALGCMVLATAASITHLTVPTRFFAMIINHRSPLVWEVRLAGALTASLGAQVLSDLGFLPGFGVVLPWTSLSLAILFLISTGWAYQFSTHPAWKTNILFGYYLASASMIGICTLLHHIPEPLFSSRHRDSPMRTGFSHSSLSEPSVQNVVDLTENDRFRQRPKDFDGISRICPSSPRADYFRPTLHGKSGIIFSSSGIEQRGGNRS